MKSPKSNILFVDDDYVNYLYFSELLSDASVWLIRACSLQDALSALQLHDDILAVMVCGRLALSNDFEVVKELKREKLDIPVLAVTGDTRWNARKLIDAGYDSYFNSHIDNEYLIEALNSVLNIPTHIK